MYGRSCAIVLVGAQTANRPWVRYEIVKAWNDGKGVLGIRIHRLLNKDAVASTPGTDPFDVLTLGSKKMSSVISLKNPTGQDSRGVYATIASNIENWIEEAVKIRKDYRG